MTWRTAAIVMMAALQPASSGSSAVIQADGSVGDVSARAGKHLVRSGKHLPQAELIEEVAASNTSQDETSSFKLALYVKQMQGPLKYAWAGWDSCEEYDSGGDQKTKFYCAKAKSVKITFVGASRGVFKLKPNGEKSLKDLFTGAHQVLGDVNHWGSVAHCFAPHCNLMGFQSRATSRKCRFGLITNNENDCNSPDHTAGVGCTIIATGSHATCCASCAKKEFDTKIEVEPLICEEDVCPKEEKVLKKELPDFCEGSECTVDECCDPKPKSASQMSHFAVPMLLLSGLML